MRSRLKKLCRIGIGDLFEMNEKRKKSHLLGLGFDGDGHKRITEAEKFSIVGGSEETHDFMTETAIKTFEELKRKGKELEDASPQELSDILRKSMPDRR